MLRLAAAAALSISERQLALSRLGFANAAPNALRAAEASPALDAERSAQRFVHVAVPLPESSMLVTDYPVVNERLLCDSVIDVGNQFYLPSAALNRSHPRVLPITVHVPAVPLALPLETA